MVQMHYLPSTSGIVSIGWDAADLLLHFAVDQNRSNEDLLDSCDPRPLRSAPPNLSLHRAGLDSMRLVGRIERRLIAIVLLQNDYGEVGVGWVCDCLDCRRVGIHLPGRLCVNSLVFLHLRAVMHPAIRAAH